MSIILVSSAITAELYSMYVLINNYELPHYLKLLFWIGRFALIIHLIESLIMVYYMQLRNENYIRYGIYAFLVGTVSLLELKNNRNRI